MVFYHEILTCNLTFSRFCRVFVDWMAFAKALLLKRFSGAGVVVPLWAVFGCGAAILSAVMMLLQERLRVDGYALAIWCKIACMGVTLPFVLVHGLPDAPLFYLFLGLGAVMWSISDVIFFRGIPVAGAGAISRVLPSSIIISFLLWFIIDPALLRHYMASPWVFAGIVAVMAIWVFCATNLRKCPVSMRALRAVWFVLVAASIGPLLAKLTTLNAPIAQGPYAYVFIEAFMMVGILGVYGLLRRPISSAVFFAPATMRWGLLIGGVMAVAVLLGLFAYYGADNPAYVPAVKLLDAVIILAVYMVVARRANRACATQGAAVAHRAWGDIWSGLGVVACAAALIALKSFI